MEKAAKDATANVTNNLSNGITNTPKFMLTPVRLHLSVHLSGAYPEAGPTLREKKTNAYVVTHQAWEVIAASIVGVGLHEKAERQFDCFADVAGAPCDCETEQSEKHGRLISEIQATNS